MVQWPSWKSFLIGVSVNYIGYKKRLEWSLTSYAENSEISGYCITLKLPYREFHFKKL